MIDKEIIIDDIDVSKCIYLDIEEDTPNYPEIDGTYTKYDCRIHCRECEFISPRNCYYKQLEMFKKKYNCYSCGTCNGKEDYINMKKHCENAIIALHKAQGEYELLRLANEELKYKLTLDTTKN